MRYVCIHGHFYQPPRENPSLEAVELQDSAYPYHDWNERITAECYAPNAVSRVLDSENHILKLVNNYSQISFNFGPTLLSWLQSERPKVYNAILEADKISSERFSGHGSAISNYVLAASLRVCGCPKPRSTLKAWKSWPHMASNSRFSLPDRPSESGKRKAPNGRT